MYLDYDWIDFVDVRVTGEARDEVTDDRGATSVVDESSVRFETDRGLLTVVAVEPPELDGSTLVGHPLRTGFRRKVREVHEPGGGTLGLLLDDVSGAMIAAGYVHAMQGLTDPAARAARGEAAPYAARQPRSPTSAPDGEPTAR